MELVRAGAEGCLPVVPSPTESGMGVKPTWGAPAPAVMLGTAVAPPDPVGVSVGLKVPPGRAVGVRVAVGRVGAAVWVALGDTVARGVASIGTTSVEAGADTTVLVWDLTGPLARYSYRNAIVGFTETARRVGTRHAIIATTASKSDTATKVDGSVAVTS